MNIIYVLIGGFVGALLASLGGFLAIWFQTKKARQVRREEIMAEKHIEANVEAFNQIKDLRSVMQQSTPEQVLEWITRNEKWFCDSRLFLPGNFVEKWLSMRKYCQRIVKLKTTLAQIKDELRKGGIIDEMGECESYCTELAEKALDEIYSDMNISPITFEAAGDDRAVTDQGR